MAAVASSSSSSSSSSHWTMLTVLFMLVLCVISIEGSRSPPGTLRQMMSADHPKNNASGTVSSIKPMEYYPKSNKVAHYALCESNKAEYYGATAVFSVHSLPQVKSGQESSVELLVSNTHKEVIGAGWHVKPELYGDNQVHFFTTWTADNYQDTGCFNLDCPGFTVQQGSPIFPGSLLASVQQITISIKKAVSPSADWQLYLDDGFSATVVGRWPNNLFTLLNDHADTITLGGHVVFSKGDSGPPMGSGHFPGGAAASASVGKLQFFDGRGSAFDFELGDETLHIDSRECYNGMFPPHTTSGSDGGLTFFYGGPSGCKDYN